MVIHRARARKAHKAEWPVKVWVRAANPAARNKVHRVREAVRNKDKAAVAGKD
jgi:hypothetical protein